MEALTQLEQAGIQLKQNKCVFLLHSMEYLGHAISEARLKTTADTFRALVDAPEPKGSSHAVVYLLRGSKEKFIPNLSSALASPNASAFTKYPRGGFGVIPRQNYLTGS